MTPIQTAKSLWMHLTGSVATVCGVAAVILLLLQGRFWGVVVVVLILGVRYMATTAIKRPRPSAEALANWSGVHAMTTVVCLVLPFYLSLSM